MLEEQVMTVADMWSATCQTKVPAIGLARDRCEWILEDLCGCERDDRLMRRHEGGAT